MVWLCCSSWACFCWVEEHKLCVYTGTRGMFVVFYIISPRVPGHAHFTHFLVPQVCRSWCRPRYSFPFHMDCTTQPRRPCGSLGDCFLGVPTWAGFVMKAVGDLGYPYTIDAQSMHPIDLPAIKELLRSQAVRPWHELAVRYHNFAHLSVPNFVLIIGGFVALRMCRGTLFCPCVSPPLAGFPSVSDGCAWPPYRQWASPWGPPAPPSL